MFISISVKIVLGLFHFKSNHSMSVWHDLAYAILQNLGMKLTGPYKCED
jgi:hypothetical protein